MSAQLDIVYKLKEALETGNPEVSAPFMADDFTHQALPAQLGAPRRSKDQWKAHVKAINSSLKSLKFEILDTIDNPGSITLHTIAHCAFNDEEPDIPVEIVFVFKFIQDETGATKLISTLEFMDSLAMVNVAERQAKGKKV